MKQAVQVVGLPGAQAAQEGSHRWREPSSAKVYPSMGATQMVVFLSGLGVQAAQPGSQVTNTPSMTAALMPSPSELHLPLSISVKPLEHWLQTLPVVVLAQTSQLSGHSRQAVPNGQYPFAQLSHPEAEHDVHFESEHATHALPDSTVPAAQPQTPLISERPGAQAGASHLVEAGLRVKPATQVSHLEESVARQVTQLATLQVMVAQVPSFCSLAGDLQEEQVVPSVQSRQSAMASLHLAHLVPARQQVAEHLEQIKAPPSQEQAVHFVMAAEQLQQVTPDGFVFTKPSLQDFWQVPSLVNAQPPMQAVQLEAVQVSQLVTEHCRLHALPPLLSRQPFSQDWQVLAFMHVPQLLIEQLFTQVLPLLAGTMQPGLQKLHAVAEEHSWQLASAFRQAGSQTVPLEARAKLVEQVLQEEAVRHSAQLEIVHLSALHNPPVILQPSLHTSQVAASLLQVLQKESEQMGQQPAPLKTGWQPATQTEQIVREVHWKQLVTLESRQSTLQVLVLLSRAQSALHLAQLLGAMQLSQLGSQVGSQLPATGLYPVPQAMHCESLQLVQQGTEQADFSHKPAAVVVNPARQMAQLWASAHWKQLANLQRVSWQCEPSPANANLEVAQAVQADPLQAEQPCPQVAEQAKQPPAELPVELPVELPDAAAKQQSEQMVLQVDWGRLAQTWQLAEALEKRQPAAQAEARGASTQEELLHLQSMQMPVPQLDWTAELQEKFPAMVVVANSASNTAQHRIDDLFIVLNIIIMGGDRAPSQTSPLPAPATPTRLTRQLPQNCEGCPYDL